MEVYIAGEDQATKEILVRLIDNIEGLSIFIDLPARGGKIKSMISKFNSLSDTRPVILLTDLDQYNCPPELLSVWFKKEVRNENFYARVAFDEAEAWLMADREGFSNYFKVPIDKIPASTTISRLKPDVNELRFPYKSSLYFTNEIIPHSSSKQFREDFKSDTGSLKGPLYNTRLIPFIKNHWNIEMASSNSHSLRNTIRRLQTIVH